MIEKIWKNIVSEAKNSQIILNDNIVRVGFNVNNPLDNTLPNFYIKDYNLFLKKLTEYIDIAIPYYNLEYNNDNVKKLLTYLWSNITKYEMNDLTLFVSKYINFIKEENITNVSGKKYTSLGNLYFDTNKQSYKQETPYVFSSFFEENSNKFYLPSISYGISNGVCYIYSVQYQKHDVLKDNPEYNRKVKATINKINSGINKYRNVTPSFVVAVSLFLSFLKENNINKIKLELPLPIRQINRDKSIKELIETKEAKLENFEKFKLEVLEKRDNIEYNTTIKFVNTFNRLLLHFPNIFLNFIKIDNNLIMDIYKMSSKNEFLNEITKQSERREEYGKISKYSSC